MNDLRFSIRQLLKNPGFTAVAVMTLALGIGATTALFSVVYGVLIKPYPYAKPEEIWAPGLRSVNANQTMHSYRLEEYLEMTRLDAFAEVMCTAPGSVLLTGEFAPETMGGIRVSGNAFSFLGVQPVLGRTIQPFDISPGGVPEPVAVLSFKRWQRLFGGDPNAIGRKLRLDDQLYTIIGVMPPRFGWWTDDGVWLPLGTDERARLVFPIVRLKPGLSPMLAEQQLHPLQLELARVNPAGFPREEFTSQLTNYLEITAASGTMQRSLRLLFGAVGILLLIACANVANLQLAKATARTREMAIRLAIGAGRGQLIRQLLSESVLVSLMGGVLGLLFAYWITDLIVTMMPGFLVPNEARIEVNRQVLSFCLVTSALTGILFGLAPALQSSRPDLVEALKDQAQGSSGFLGGRGLRGFLVIAEVAMSVVLLVGAGLTVRSFLSLQKVELGFQPDRVMAVGLLLPPKLYATWEQRNRFAAELLGRVQNLPGVVAATIGNGGLPFGGPQSAFSIEGRTESESRRITLHAVSVDYLRTVGVPLRQGRMLTATEIQDALPVAVINEAAARLWPAGEDPLGKRIRVPLLERPGNAAVLTPTNASPEVRIVGIIGDVRNDDLRTDPQPAVLVPYTLLAPPQRTLAIRTQGDPVPLMNTLRAQVRAMDPQQPVDGPTTFEEMLDTRRAQPRFVMTLFSLFAGLGLTLAVAGIYSVLSYFVSMRTREIGVRMALGAQPADILGWIFGLGGKLVGAGLVVGVLAGLAAARLLAGQLELFRVTAADPASLLAVILLLCAVAAAACHIPARRATRVEPLKALRYE